jgi:DNA repair protein RadC
MSSVAVARPRSAAPNEGSGGHRNRLRQRFIDSSGKGLADYELLEMLLFAAHPRGDVKPLAKRLIARFGSLAKVLQALPEELLSVDGVGLAAVCSIKAVQEGAERMLGQSLKQQLILARWDQLLDYCRVSMGHLKEEQFRIFFLNRANELIADELQQKGSVDHAPVYVREVVKRALVLGASAMILCHNHPSGKVEPSKADVQITREIMMAARLVGVLVHDHLIIGGENHFSMRSNGLL